MGLLAYIDLRPYRRSVPYQPATDTEIDKRINKLIATLSCISYPLDANKREWYRTMVHMITDAKMSMRIIQGKVRWRYVDEK